MSDLMTRLATARPTETELDAMWSPSDRELLLGRVLAGRRRRPSRRVWAGGAAATLAAGVLVPSLLGAGQSAAAADLHALADSAVTYDGPALGPGTWLHETGTSRQHQLAGRQRGETWSHTRETWTGYDGRVYLIDRDTAGTVEYTVFDDNSAPSYQDPTPAFSATLPDDADGLLAYLSPRVFGSSSHAEAMFGALADLAGSHTLPPRTLAAAFDALATIDAVTTEDVELAGRPAVEISYDEELTHSTESYVFDRATGQQLSTHNESRQSDVVSTTTLSEVVDEVPPEVLARFDTNAG